MIAMSIFKVQSQRKKERVLTRERARVKPALKWVICMGFTVLVGACGQDDRVLSDFATIDFDTIEMDDRLPAVARQGEPLTGPVYRATLRFTADPSFFAHLDPTDPAVREDRLAWDDMTAEYFFYCDSQAPLMSSNPGRERHRLQGQEARELDSEADAKQRVFLDWREIQTDDWGGKDGIGARAAKRVCQRVRRT